MKAPEAFANAVAPMPFPPPSVDEFWEVWCRRAVPSSVPRVMFKMIVLAYPGLLEVRAFGGIAAIIVNDYVRVFAPDAVLWPKRESVDPMGPMAAWLKSNKGYVRDPMKITEMAREETSR